MENFESGIHALVSKDNKFLLIKRNSNYNYDPDCWDLPGGGINFGEQPLETIIRETKEETDIDINIGKILHTCGVLTEPIWSIEIYVEGEYLKGDVVLSSEHSSFMWLTREELRAIEPKGVHVKNILEFI
jgi:8-oxo-dGTP diphosphatase